MRAGTKTIQQKIGPSFASHDQKTLWVCASRKLLSLLEMYAEHNFEGIASGDWFWFQYFSYSHSMFAGSRESVVPGIRRNISGQETLLPIFFTSTRLLVLEPLPKGTKYDQNYFIDAIFPGLYNEKRRISRKKHFPTFSVHMDIGGKQSPYSPGLFHWILNDLLN
jgi:hypothetical protein